MDPSLDSPDQEPPQSLATLPTEPAPAAEADPADSDSHSHTRNGKVARLPKEVRDQVNQMLLDNVPFAKIIESLGDQGKGITYRNMTNWKAGGYKEWLLDEERKDALILRRDSAISLLNEKAGATVQDASRTIAAAQLYELLLTFDPTVFAQSLAEKPELYLRLISALARLSEGEAVCASQRAKESLLPDKLKTQTTNGHPSNVISAEGLKDILRQIKLL
jgi:hypothetical protein